MFEVEVDRDGRARGVTLHGAIGTPLMVRVSETAVRRSRFAPAAAPYRGQIAIVYALRRDEPPEVESREGSEERAQDLD